MTACPADAGSPGAGAETCGTSYRSGSGRYYDCERPSGHTASHLPFPDLADLAVPSPEDTQLAVEAVASVELDEPGSGGAYTARAPRQSAEDTVELDGRQLLAQAVAVDAADRELERAIREWAAPDDDLGWVGSPEVAEHAEELAAFLCERGYELPTAPARRKCCRSSRGQQHAEGCPAMAELVATAETEQEFSS